MWKICVMITCALVLYASCSDDSPTKPSEPEKESIEVYVVESLTQHGYTPEEFLERWPPNTTPPLALDITILESNEIEGRAFIHRLGWLDFVEGTKLYGTRAVYLNTSSSMIITAPDSLYPIERIVFLDVKITQEEITGRYTKIAPGIDYSYIEFIARKGLWYE